MLDFLEKGMQRSHPEEGEGTSAERQRQGYTNEHWMAVDGGRQADKMSCLMLMKRKGHNRECWKGKAGMDYDCPKCDLMENVKKYAKLERTV